jgi:predicted MFS family arabinose efflux permease
MNFNTSLYSNGLGGISEQFGVSEQAARVGAAIFLVTYAFGCELWAPWSEEFGRKIVLQLSLGLVNLWCLPVALAPNFGSLLVGRALGGVSSAGGRVTVSNFCSSLIHSLWPRGVIFYMRRVFAQHFANAPAHTENVYSQSHSSA